MVFIYHLIESLVYFVIKYVLLLTTLSVAVCYGVVFIRKLLFKGVISSDGKTVLITGCDSGFGNRLAKRLCKMGFRVYATVLSTTSKGAQELQSNPEFADNVVVLQMDVTNDEEVKEVYEKVKTDLESSGHVLWAVVNNAGFLSFSLLEWGTLDLYRKTFEINVFGMVRVTRVFLPLIRASNGRITNISSPAGRSWSWKPGGIYSMSKHSVVAFTDTLRRELNKFNVSVSSIEPGFFKTPLTEIKGLNKHLEDNFNRSTDEVKEFYGSPDDEMKLIKESLNSFPVEENIDIVVDDMIDSIVNCWPKTIYRPMRLIYKSLLYLDIFAPSFLDWLLIISEKYFLR